MVSRRRPHGKPGSVTNSLAELAQVAEFRYENEGDPAEIDPDDGEDGEGRSDEASDRHEQTEAPQYP